MESLLNQSQDSLIHGLDFSISSNTAQYVEERSERNWLANAQLFSPAGVRTIRVNIADNSFVDLSSLVLVGVLKNDNAAQPMDPLTAGIHGAITRFTAYVSGTKAEDIMHYGRTTEQFLRMMPEDVRRNLATASGFGSAASGPDAGGLSIGGGKEVRFTHKPILSGICNSGKYMPLQFLGAGGLVLEFELGNADSWVSTAENHSTSWTIRDVRIQASVININSQLMEAYSAHVLSGKALLIPYKTFVCTSSALPDSDDFDVSIARNFTRLCTLFQTFSTTEEAITKEVNTFYSPVNTIQSDEFQSVLHIGSKRWSDFDRTGSAQHYYYLLQALGYANSLVSSANIDLGRYKSTSFIASWDVEKVPQAIMSGYNTSGGQSITTSWKKFGSTTANRAKKTFFVAHHDAVLELSATSAQVHS